MIKLLALVAMLAIPLVGVARGYPTVRLSLAESHEVQAEIQPGLYLKIDATDGVPEVEVWSIDRIPHCPDNLLHWAGHGPDPSEIMQWQLTRHVFGTMRVISVCGFPLEVRIELIGLKPAPKRMGMEFSSGTIVASVLPGKKYPGYWPR